MTDQLPQVDLNFSGSTYEPEFDKERLTGQRRRVFNCMTDGKWRTLKELAQLIEELRTLPQDGDVIAGEWVSPSQLGAAVVKVCPDYCSGGVSRIHIFAPKPEIFEDVE